MGGFTTYADGEQWVDCCFAQYSYWTSLHSTGELATRTCDTFTDDWEGPTTTTDTICWTETHTQFDTPEPIYNDCIDTYEIAGESATVYYWPTPTTSDSEQRAATAVVGTMTL